MERVFESLEEAVEFFRDKDYKDVLYNTADIVVSGNEMLTIGGGEFNYSLDFIASLFKYTKLPKRNENVLPTENVLNDLNTILRNNAEEVKIRFVDGVAFSIFPTNGKGIKLPLTNKMFLEVLSEELECEQVKIELCDSFLRFSGVFENYLVETDDTTYAIGIDVTNGESYKSNPITINSHIIDMSTNDAVVMPLLDKPMKIGAAYKPEKIKEKLKTELKKRININLVRQRFDRIKAFELNDEIIRVLFSGTKFLPIASREDFFSPFFKSDENGKMTSIVDKNSIINKMTVDIIKELIAIVSAERQNIDSENRYKADCFVGSLYSENNKKFNEALLAV